MEVNVAVARKAAAHVAKEAEGSAPEQGYAEVVARLEAVVSRLEQGELTLEASLQAFEDGIGLVRKGEQLLDRAEQRVEALLKQGGEDVAVPLETPVNAGATTGARGGRRRGEPAAPEPDPDDIPF